MYIELTKSNAENKTLFDPTGKGLADLGGPGEAWKVRTVGKAKDRFEEDPLRILRAIRFHCRGGSTQSPGALDKEIKEAIPNFLNMGNRLRGVDRIKGEFDKGLKHPDTDMKCYISTLKSTKLLNVLFPDVVFDPPNGIPVEFSSEKDRILQIAWILQHNPIEKVKEVLSVSRMAGGVGDNPLGPKQTGWESHDARAVVFLLRLKEFTPDQVGEMLRNQKGTGLSKGQIEKWVSMFDKVRSRTDIKTPHIKNVTKFANYESQATWPEVQEKGGDICPYCEHAPDSFECERCMSSRKLPKGMRGRAVHDLETEKFIAHK
jgi:tRNA nucleotidyltransferase/poly(A) polymerase